MINVKDREALEKLHALYKSSTFKGEVDSAKDAILKILNKYGLGWDDLQAIINPCVLDLVDDLIDLYIWMPPRERMVVSLWTLHVYVYKQFNVTPRLAVLSSDPDSGKSALMELIQHMVPWLWNMPDIYLSPTAAALYQAVEAGGAAVMLIDEVDNLALTTNGTLRTILNANRKGQGIPRGSGPQKGGGITGPKLYYPFIPIVVGGLGRLPRALTTRCHVIIMRPKPSHITKLKVNPQSEEFLAMTSAVRAAADNWSSNIILEQDPVFELNNRDHDNWRPFISIADHIDRGEKVRNLAKAMTGGPREYSETMQMRIDTRRIFNELRVDRIDRTVLLDKLHDFDKWNEWGRPSRLTRNEFSAIMREIGTPPPHIFQHKGSRKDRGKAGWGWYRSDFEEAWKDCPEEDPKAGPQGAWWGKWGLKP
jgi:hypothetical protein